MSDRLTEVIRQIIKFRDDRDWRQFHDPKNLAEAISIEAGELLENFLWLTSDESRHMDSARLGRVREEVGDVLILTMYLCHGLDIDPIDAMESKLRLNHQKYPVDRARGRRDKYTRL
jgi:NTP pyrophosphatase (non-canonical NTP hydrolase)